MAKAKAEWEREKKKLAQDHQIETEKISQDNEEQVAKMVKQERDK